MIMNFQNFKICKKKKIFFYFNLETHILMQQNFSKKKLILKIKKFIKT